MSGEREQRSVMGPNIYVKRPFSREKMNRWQALMSSGYGECGQPRKPDKGRDPLGTVVGWNGGDHERTEAREFPEHRSQPIPPLFDGNSTAERLFISRAHTDPGRELRISPIHYNNTGAAQRGLMGCFLPRITGCGVH